MHAEFYLEIGAEEIPARTMSKSLEDLTRRVADFLNASRVHYDRIESSGTARRFVLHIPSLADRQEPRTERVMGPPAKAAWRDGLPTPALDGFARKAGLAIDQLKTYTTEKGDYVGYESYIEGKSIGELLGPEIPAILRAMTFPKTMIWSDREARFSRPVRWIVSRYGEQVLDIEAFGVRSGTTTQGHRILGSDRIEVHGYDDYVTKLRENFVIVSERDRTEKIESELAVFASQLGGHVILDTKLLEEVVFINEYPTVLLGSFDRRFLELPREILVTVMKEHQKYFALEQADRSGLLPHFLAVTNTPGDPRSFIRKGHERVLRARLSDALFFYEGDARRSLEERRDDLKRIVFQARLGSYADKVKRMIRLVPKINRLTRARVPAGDLRQAVEWSKCDLATDMVREFTDLQGVVGGLYARREGASVVVWKAIYDQYRPVSLEDRSPETASGAVLSIIDRLDTLGGCFSAGLIPTGSEDPFGLRRQMQGLLKILLDHGLSFSWMSAMDAVSQLTPERRQQLQTFADERLRFIFSQMGFAYDEINAVAASGMDDPQDTLLRLRAVQAVRTGADFEALSAAFKRIQNILKQAEQKGELLEGEILPEGMEPAEEELYRWVLASQPKIQQSNRRRNYRATLERMAGARPVVDHFFEKIMVMHQDNAIRSQRLRLLKRLAVLFLDVADISEVVAAGAPQR